jgi:hypothetical protein
MSYLPILTKFRLVVIQTFFTAPDFGTSHILAPSKTKISNGGHILSQLHFDLANKNYKPNKQLKMPQYGQSHNISRKEYYPTDQQLTTSKHTSLSPRVLGID